MWSYLLIIVSLFVVISHIITQTDKNETLLLFHSTKKNKFIKFFVDLFMTIIILLFSIAIIYAIVYTIICLFAWMALLIIVCPILILFLIFWIHS
jgi:hypothetical protein